MGFKSQEYACEGCGHRVTDLIERGEPVPALDCSECGHAMVATFGAPAVLNHTYRSGNRRFDGLRQDMKLRKEISDAKQRGDMDSARRAQKERKKLNKGE